jgi:hypothetical protein
LVDVVKKPWVGVRKRIGATSGPAVPASSQHRTSDPPAVPSTLECGAAQDPLVQMGVDEIYFGKQMKFITAVRNWDTGEPL